MKIKTLIISIFALAASAFAETPFISTVGKATIEVPADRAVIRVYIESRDEDIQKSSSSIDSSISELGSYLTTLGVNNSLKTTEYKISTREIERDRDTSKVVFNGFVSKARVSIDLRQLEHYSAIMTYLSITPGFDGISISLSTEKEGEYRRKMIVEAVKAARAKANAIAGDNNLIVVGLLNVAEENYRGYVSAGSIGGNYIGREKSTDGNLSVSISVDVVAKFDVKESPNKSLQPTPMAVTDHAEHALRQP